eukprot:TRINITY_DN36987_c0_g1_i4.p1 TRINITY_DN36987_c0_g1~~TRINITY_DN36987_c0_g1_i4.p1  ORF type:complete len:447 (+),score=125.86 TRINITY_DN36987_c0_g1_i4:155-1495(+)
MCIRDRYLYSGDEDTTIPAPYRAMALHFGTASEAAFNPSAYLENCRVQHMQHALHKNSTMGKFKGVLPDDVRSRCVAVTLQPGDVLYHPAGVWHQVETVPPHHSADEASLSINVSLFPETYAEHVAEGIYHQMATSFHWRQRMDCRTHQGNLTQLALCRKALLESGTAATAVLSEEMLPPALHANIRPYATVATKSDDTVVPATAASVPQLAPTTLLVRNRLSVMTHTSSEPAFRIDQEADDCEDMCEKLFALVVPRTQDIKEAAPDCHGSDSDEEEDEEPTNNDVAPLQADVIPLFQTAPTKGSKRSWSEADLEKRLRSVSRFDIHFNFVGGGDDGPLQDVLHCALFSEGSELKQTLLQWAAYPYRPNGVSVSDLVEAGPSREVQIALLSYLTYIGFFYTLSLIHISEPTRLLSISYAVFCLKKKKKQKALRQSLIHISENTRKT